MAEMTFDEALCREVVSEHVGAFEGLGVRGQFEFAGTLDYMREYVGNLDALGIPLSWDEACADMGASELGWAALSDRERLDVLAGLAKSHFEADLAWADEEFRGRIPFWEEASDLAELIRRGRADEAPRPSEDRAAAGLGSLSREQLLDLAAAYDSYVAAAFDARLPETGWAPVCIGEFLDAEYRNVWLEGGDFGYMSRSARWREALLEERRAEERRVMLELVHRARMAQHVASHVELPGRAAFDLDDAWHAARGLVLPKATAEGWRDDFMEAMRRADADWAEAASRA